MNDPEGTRWEDNNEQASDSVVVEPKGGGMIKPPYTGDSTGIFGDDFTGIFNHKVTGNVVVETKGGGVVKKP